MFVDIFAIFAHFHQSRLIPTTHRAYRPNNSPLAAVQPAKSLIMGTSRLIDPPGLRLRTPDLYIIRKLSERRIRLSNNTDFDNVALNAKFITHAHEIIVHVGAPPRSDPHRTDFFSILAQKQHFVGILAGILAQKTAHFFAYF